MKGFKHCVSFYLLVYLAASTCLGAVWVDLPQLKLGQTIDMWGKPKATAKTIIIRMNAANWDQALHFKINFDSKMAVAASRLNQQWLPGKTITPFPFTRGKDFYLEIVVTSQGYDMYMDGEFIHTHKHVFPFNRVIKIGWEGDLNQDTVMGRCDLELSCLDLQASPPPAVLTSKTILNNLKDLEDDEDPNVNKDLF